MLSEGVNLQDAGILVHLDLPWTDATRAQRIGRLARLGAQHENIHVHTIAPPAGAERTLRLIETLKRKAHLSDSIVGAAPTSRSIQHTHSETAAECATRLRARLLRWQRDVDPAAQRPFNNSMTIARVNARESGWIAVFEHNEQLTALTQARSNGFRPSNSAIDMMHAIDCIVEHSSKEAAIQNACRHVDPATINSIIAEITHWHENNCINELAGRSERSVSISHKRALKLLTQRVATNSATTRNSLAIAADKIGAINRADRWRGSRITTGRMVQSIVSTQPARLARRFLQDRSNTSSDKPKPADANGCTSSPGDSSVAASDRISQTRASASLRELKFVMPRLALLFDLDGTLIDSITLLLQSMAHAFEGCAHRPTVAEWTAGIGTPLRIQISEWAANADDVITLVDRYREFQAVHLETLTTIYPGVIDLLVWAKKRGHAIGLVTSKGRGMTDRSLVHVALAGMFDVEVTVESTERHKPLADPVLHALDQLGIDRNHALFVGDSTHDMLAGKAAGVTTAAARWGPFSSEQLATASPDYWLNSMADLEPIILELEKRS